MNRYGDMPLGMVESALEFARICRQHDFHNFKFSMKSSNLKVMIECYRLLVARLEQEGPASSRRPRRSRGCTSTTRCRGCGTASSASPRSTRSAITSSSGKLWEAFAADGAPVLLIDEIDKADIEFPNDLLLELDRMEFYVYETRETVKAAPPADRRHHLEQREGAARRVPAPLLLPLHPLPRPRDDERHRRRAFSRPQARAAAARRSTPSTSCATCRASRRSRRPRSCSTGSSCCWPRTSRPRRCGRPTASGDPAAVRRAAQERAGRASVRAARVHEPAHRPLSAGPRRHAGRLLSELRAAGCRSR